MSPHQGTWTWVWTQAQAIPGCDIASDLSHSFPRCPESSQARRITVGGGPGAQAERPCVARHCGGSRALRAAGGKLEAGAEGQASQVHRASCPFPAGSPAGGEGQPRALPARLPAVASAPGCGPDPGLDTHWAQDKRRAASTPPTARPPPQCTQSCPGKSRGP